MHARVRLVVSGRFSALSGGARVAEREGMSRLALALVLTSCLALPACAEPVPRCLPVSDSAAAGVATAALRGGGWDINGRALLGGGGWDLNSDQEGAAVVGEILGLDGGGTAHLERGRLVDEQGRPLESARLVRRDGRVLEVRVVRVEAGVPLHVIRQDGARLCEGLAVLTTGTWRADGSVEDDESGERLTIACDDGAIAKCALWGYAPWRVGSATHAACTRMVRADYCGDGTAWTLDGTWIDVADPTGLQLASDRPEMIFEAGWSPEGAVCVHQSRYDARDAEGRTVRPPCWAALPRCEDRDDATDRGALLTSASLHEVIGTCE